MERALEVFLTILVIIFLLTELANCKNAPVENNFIFFSLYQVSLFERAENGRISPRAAIFIKAD